MSAASQFYVCGPSNLFVSSGPIVVGTNPTWNFLGWTRNGATVAIVPQWEDVEVDYGGREPGAIAILGQEARISGVFSRYNEPTLQLLASFGNSVNGQFNNFVLGSLLRQEKLDFGILLQCPYGAKPAFGASPSPMVPGFFFYSCHLSDPHEAVYSIRAKQPNIAFRAVPIYGTIGDGTFGASGAFTEAAPYNASIVYTTTLPSAIGGSWPSVN